MVLILSVNLGVILPFPVCYSYVNLYKCLVKYYTKISYLSPGLQMIGTKWYQIVPMVLVFKGQLKFHSTISSRLFIQVD